MTTSAKTVSARGDAILGDLPALAGQAASAAEQVGAKAASAMKGRLSADGRISGALLDREQHAAHGFAWLFTYVQAIRQIAAYAERMQREGRLGELEALIVQVGIGEYLAQMQGGIPMSQGEIVRPHEMGLSDEDLAPLQSEPLRRLVRQGNTPAVRARIINLMKATEASATFGDTGLEETYEAMRKQMRKFADDRIVPVAHQWHLTNSYIPLEVIGQLAEMGVFGMTLPEAHGGMGLGKESMCVVSEELSRGYIGVGSLGTRSEIAGELLLAHGTKDQQATYLPRIASGEIIPTAVFTEPNTGSDLASLRTRAVLEGDVYKVTGQKTWITHPVRADLMTLLVRTGSPESGYKGLSMFLAEKPRGTDADPFPAKGMTGGEIEVLGYRGMKEFDISFDGFEVPAKQLLGGKEGEGFKQLMATFESARIQTAARAIGVAQCALELSLKYASDRIQFGKATLDFPRVADKIVMMAVEIMMVRQLTYFAAREKDQGRRCDLEAGMAKLLAARVAWAAADNGVQIHGGNGFALEYPISRVLCDARILNIFEGAAEIQAQVIARRILEGGVN